MLKRFWQDEAGAEMVEWAVVTIILLAWTAAAIIALREQIIDVFNSAFTRIQEPPPDTY
jgi:Flp pilus assembly pilin Flp